MPVHDSSATTLVDRPALIDALDGDGAHRISAIVAQAGSGKSILLQQWMQRHDDLDVVRVDLTPADVDPAHFAARLLAGVSAVRPAAAGITPRLAASGRSLGIPFLASLAESLAGPALVIIVDDLHRLDGTPLIADLGYLIETSPPNVRFLVASRMDHAILSAQRLRAGLVEIRQADLAMDLDQSAEVLARAAGAPLSAAQVQIVFDKTEGWVAGLRLAGLTLRRRDDHDAFVASFSGSDRLVSDYLGEEVLATLSAKRRTTVLRMAALDLFSAPLLADLWLDRDGVDALRDIREADAFVVALDDRGEWFRFHHLFRDLLRYRLRSEDPSGERELLRRAAAWHLDRDEVNRAVEYLLRAEAWDSVIPIIVGRGAEVFERGQVLTVLGWIARIPAVHIEPVVDLCLLHGILCGLAGRIGEADDILRRVSVRSDASYGQQLCALALLAALVQWRQHPSVSVNLAVRAMDALERIGDRPVPDILHLSDVRSMETMVLLSGGRGHFLRGDLSAARDWLVRSLASEGSVYSIWRISALGSLALVEAWEGQWDAAAALAGEAREVATVADLAAHPSLADAYLALALVAGHGALHQTAMEAFAEGLVRATANGRQQLLWVCWAVDATIARDGEVTGHLDRPHGIAPAVVTTRLQELETWRLSAAALPERLTRREMQILAYLPTRLGNRDMAEQSFVSVNTIKTQVSNIYRKLGVTSRDAAVDRAREIGLLRRD